MRLFVASFKWKKLFQFENNFTKFVLFTILVGFKLIIVGVLGERVARVVGGGHRGAAVWKRGRRGRNLRHHRLLQKRPRPAPDLEHERQVVLAGLHLGRRPQTATGGPLFSWILQVSVFYYSPLWPIFKF